MWDHAEEVLGGLLKQIAAASDGRITDGRQPGEGTFYGPKFEYVLNDAIGREWQCGTTQIDFNLPERFGAFYWSMRKQKHAGDGASRDLWFDGALSRHPHRTMRGRFRCGWRPARSSWPPSFRTQTSTRERGGKLSRPACRAEVDLRNEKINYKVREHSLAKVPVMLVFGKREAEEGTVNMRRLGSRDQQSLSLDAAMALLTEEALPPDLRRKQAAKAAA